MLQSSERRLAFFIMVIVLVAITATRILRLNDYAMNPDEIWSVWQTLGTPTQIVQWIPYDWPPLYYLTLGVWRSFVGIHPGILRLFSTLFFLIGTSGIYRVGRRLHSHRAGVMTALAYAAISYGILLSIEVRGYSLLLGIMPFALWFTIRYFDHPQWRRAVPLAVLLAAMFYISLTSIGAFIALGLYALVVYRFRIWHGWLPALISALLASPEILHKTQIAASRVAATRTLNTQPLLPALADLLWRYMGDVVLVWAILLSLVLLILFIRRTTLQQRLLTAILLWVFVVPLMLYVFNPWIGFFSARYSWWMMIGIAIFVGLGLSYLPRIGMIGASILLIGIAFYPLPREGEFKIWGTLSPLNENFNWLNAHMVPGDVMLLDPAQRCGGPEEWDYYLRLHFPNGLTFIDPEQISGHRRIWYIINNGNQQPDIEQRLKSSHVQKEFVGPGRCVFRLYEAPPDTAGIGFENGMRFHGVDIIRDGKPYSAPLALHEGETIHLRLWWSADQPPQLDYSVGIFIIRDNNQIADSNSAPQTQPPETSRWVPNQFYIEEREISLPYPTAGGGYGLFLALYYWEEQRRLNAPGINEAGLLPLKRFFVKAY
jgi:hypothetical protein